MEQIQNDKPSRGFWPQIAYTLTALAALSMPGSEQSKPENTDLQPVGARVNPLESLKVPQHVVTERLVLVGGGAIPTEALSRFMEWSGGSEAKILVVPWSSWDQKDSFDSIKNKLEPYGPAQVVCAPLRNEIGCKKAEFVEMLNSATGVWFTGGNQNRTMDVLIDDDLMKAVRGRFREGVVYGGTSAGTAIMSDPMLTGDTSRDPDGKLAAETREGLGLLGQGIVVDQHFIQRNREERLVAALLQTDERVGIGVDEDTAVSIENGRYAEVIGPGQVIIFNNRSTGSRPSREPLHPSDKFDLEKMEHTRRAQ